MTSRLHRVCLSLGSNIHPEQALPQAVRRLRGLFPLERVSRVWETPAVGSDGPNFLNAAVTLLADRDPAALKDEVLRPLEAELGRVRGPDKNAPRTIDLDVLVCDGAVVDPQLWQRAHLAVPAVEAWNQPLLAPDGESLQAAAARLARQTPILPRPDVQLN